MIMIPAIDLWEGEVVRFLKGNPAFSTVYSKDPLAIVEKWINFGAEIIHLVDLSAALGKTDNSLLIKNILKNNDVRVEVGGGIRNLRKAEELISLGAERVIIGTRAIEKDFLKNLINLFGPEKIAVGVDVLESQVAVNGWQEKSNYSAFDFMRSLQDIGVKWVIYTDISRDGTLEGVDLTFLKGFSLFNQMNIILSGGVSCLEDIQNIKDEIPFVRGIISGKALYEGKINFLEAVNILS